MTRAVPIALAFAVTLAAPARAEQVGAEPYQNGIGVGAGLHIFLLEDTPLGELLSGYGLGFTTGPAFTLSYDRRMLPWLSVGGTLAFRYSEERPSKSTAGIRSAADPDASEAGLYMLTPRVFGRASFYTPDNGVDGSALEMGIELSVGVGATLLGWRGVTDAAAHVELGAALLWSLHIGCWAATLRIIHQGIWQEGIGPLDVAFGPTWMPTIDLRLEKRW